VETYKKMERTLIDITLPRMEDKPKSLNTQRYKGTQISITTHLKLLVNDPLKLIMIRYLVVDCN